MPGSEAGQRRHRRAWVWLPGAVVVIAGLVIVGVVVLDGSGDGQESSGAAEPAATASPQTEPTDGATPTTAPTPSSVDQPETPSAPAEGGTGQCDAHVSATADGGDGSRDQPYASVDDALRALDPGGVVCLLEGRYEEPITITTSGQDGAELVVRGLDGASVRSVQITADHVTVESLEITGATDPGGEGVLIDGRGIKVTNNDIHDMVGVAIGCVQTFRDEQPRCIDAEIVDNTITRIDGWGIWIWGENNLVAGNDISRVFAVVSEDADAVRFFGAGHVIRHNYIHDIYEAEAGPDREPHSDCFQTYDLEGAYPALQDIVIEGNVCSTDRHGVIMTQLLGLPASNIRIENNVFVSDGAAAVLLLGDGVGPPEQYRGVRVINNLITGVVEFHGIQAANGAGVTIVNNLFLGDFEPFSGTSLDDGKDSVTADNMVATAQDFTDVDDPDVRARYRLAPGSAAIDAARDDLAPALDLEGTRRPLDGDSDGQALPDLGPYELRPAP